MPDHVIDDAESFHAVAGEPRQVAGLYWYMLMDPLVSLAHAVALDFFRRPHLYTAIDAAAVPAIEGGAEHPPGEAEPAEEVRAESRDPEGVAQVDRGGVAVREHGFLDGAGAGFVLATLRATYGHLPQVPSDEQREEVYVAVFGDSAPGLGAGDFNRLSGQLIAAATAFAERVYDTGLEMLRQRVRIQHRLLREYLRGVHGASVRFSVDVALGAMTGQLAYPLLRNANVASVFGVVNAAAEEWPYRPDANGDKLVEQVTRQLAVAGNGVPLSRERFTRLQSAALSGTEALATIIDVAPEEASDAEQDALITRVYAWGANLAALQTAG
jgi:hypothetical protein